MNENSCIHGAPALRLADQAVMIYATARHGHQLDAAGTVNSQEGVTRFTEIVLRPCLVLATRTDQKRALRRLERSEKQCSVSASLSTHIRH